jgi:hypothetical protein
LIGQAPKPPSELQIGSNINDEIVVDFRPAISPVQVQGYTIKYWPVAKSGEEPVVAQPKTIQVSGNETIGVVVPDLPRDTEYNFQVVASLSDGTQLVSDPVMIRTPAEEVRCDCSHYCKLVETDTIKWSVECSCYPGYELAGDSKTCVQIEPRNIGAVVKVSSCLFWPSSHILVANVLFRFRQHSSWSKKCQSSKTLSGKNRSPHSLRASRRIRRTKVEGG